MGNNSMKRQAFSKIYAIALTIAFVGAEILLLCMPAFRSTDGALSLIEGLIVALIFAPTIHEIGHISFALAQGMKLRYSKFFCVKIQKQGGRYAFSLANPFVADETQVVPTRGGDMKRRAVWYALGGLIYSGVVLSLFLAAAIILSCFGIHSAKLWGLVPFWSYLFLANCFPLEYASGKTDALIVSEIKSGEPVAQAFLAVMDVQGRLFAGEEYAKIEDAAFAFPVLAEDEPLFPICCDLKYRRALDEGDYVAAADSLKRWAQSEEYLTDFERQKLAAELTYMHALGEDFDSANKSAKFCEKFLKSQELSAKRILATIAFKAGKIDEAKTLKEEALSLLNGEDVVGERLLEEKLVKRLDFDKE